MLVKRNYSTPAYSRLFADFFDNELGNWSRSNFSKTETTLPAVNILETDEQFSVEVAAPGMKKEDFDIQIHDNVLTISSEKSTESEEKEKEKLEKRIINMKINLNICLFIKFNF